MKLGIQIAMIRVIGEITEQGEGEGCEPLNIKISIHEPILFSTNPASSLKIRMEIKVLT